MLTYQTSFILNHVSSESTTLAPVVTSGIEFKNKNLDLTRNAVVSNSGIELVSCWTLPQYVTFSETKCNNSPHLVTSYEAYTNHWLGYNELLKTELREAAISTIFTNLVSLLPVYGQNIRLKKFLSLLFLAQSADAATVKIVNDSLIKYMTESYVPYLAKNNGQSDHQTFLVRSTGIAILVLVKKILGLSIPYESVDRLFYTTEKLELHVEITSDFMEDLFHQLLTAPLHGLYPSDQRLVYRYIIRESIAPKLINLAYRIFDLRNESPCSVEEVVIMQFFGKN